MGKNTEKVLINFKMELLTKAHLNTTNFKGKARCSWRMECIRGSFQMVKWREWEDSPGRMVLSTKDSIITIRSTEEGNT